jgi:hypothetical protein
MMGWEGRLRIRGGGTRLLRYKMGVLNGAPQQTVGVKEEVVIVMHEGNVLDDEYGKFTQGVHWVALIVRLGEAMIREEDGD